MKTLEKEFIDYLTSMAKNFGLDDLALKVFAVLYIEPEPIAMDQVAKKTGYSLASISNTMKLFETMGAVERSKKPGSRKVFFYMDKDLIKWNIMKLDYAQRTMIAPAKAKLPKIIKRYKEKAKTNQEKKRIEIITGYHDQVVLFEKLFKKWKSDLKNLRR